MNKITKIIIGVLAGLVLGSTTYAATVLFPSGGGTGTSTKPTVGQILVGLSNGTYGPVATSTLNFVPYTGATQDVDIGANMLRSSAIHANSSAGIQIHANTNGIVGMFGVANGLNSTFYGTVKLASTTASKVLVTDSLSNITSATLSSADLDAIPTTYIPYTGATKDINIDGHNFSLSGALVVSGALKDSNNSTGTLGYILQSNGTSTNWVSTSSLKILSSLSGGVNGYLTRWLSASTIGTSTILDDGVNAGVNATSSLYEFYIKGDTIGDHSPFAVASSSGTLNFLVSSTGNVGIATSTPATALVVVGTTTSSNLRIQGLTSAYLSVDPNGNVIATTTPGTVTSVDMTVPTGLTVTGSPIATSGTLALSLTSGYVIPLSASTTNWNNSFNNIYSQFVIATGTTGSGFNIATSTNSLTINVPIASASATGTLSSANWTTFNNKQAALSGGTTGFVTTWTSASALGVGKLIDNGTVLGINSTSSTVNFNIKGSAGTFNPFAIASSSGSTYMFVNQNGYLGFGTSTFPTSNTPIVTIDASTSASEEGLNIFGTVNDFFESNVFNRSNGTKAQSCTTATADYGSLVNGFISICANSSAFSTTSSIVTGGAGDFSIMSYGTGDFIINNATATKSILFVTGNSSSTTNTRMKIDGSGNVGVGSTSPSTLLTVNGTTTTNALKLPRITNSFLATNSTGDVISTTTPAGGGGTTPTMKTTIPFPMYLSSVTASYAPITSAINTTMNVGLVTIPFAITANQISVTLQAAGSGDAMNIGLWSEDGQTRYFAVTTPTITGVGLATTSIPSAVIPAGNYWIGWVPNVSITGLAPYGYSTGLSNTGIYVLKNIVNKVNLEGKLTVSAATLPSTISTSSIATDTTNDTLLFRLDN